MFRTPRPAKQSPTRAFNTFNLASFTIGAEVANVINVIVQLRDAVGNPVSVPAVCVVFLSDSSDGHTLTGTVPTSTLAIGTNGVIFGVLTTDKAVIVLSKSDGTFDLNIPQTAAPVTYYLAVVLPDGSLAVSGAITYA